jgi:hypothetical protein
MVDGWDGDIGKHGCPRCRKKLLHYCVRKYLLIDAAGKYSTIDHQQVTGDKACGIRCEKYSGTGKLLDLPESPHWRAKQKFSSAFRSVKQGGIHVSTQDARNERIYADP